VWKTDDFLEALFEDVHVRETIDRDDGTIGDALAEVIKWVSELKPFKFQRNKVELTCSQMAVTTLIFPFCENSQRAAACWKFSRLFVSSCRKMFVKKGKQIMFKYLSCGT
jgi:hypothetical protein